MSNQSMWYDMDHERWGGVPDYMRQAFADYVLRGGPTGGFLSALLENDLLRAFGAADESNTRAMSAWARLLYNYAPANSHGNKENVKLWRESGGLVGLGLSN